MIKDDRVASYISSILAQYWPKAVRMHRFGCLHEANWRPRVVSVRQPCSHGPAFRREDMPDYGPKYGRCPPWHRPSSHPVWYFSRKITSLLSGYTCFLQNTEKRHFIGSLVSADVGELRHTKNRTYRHAYVCSGSAGASVVAHSVALPLIEIAFSTLDCSIVPTCGAWGSATAAKRGPLKQSWAGIQHSRDDEPLGVLMQIRNVRVNGFFFFSSLGVLPGVLVDILSLCSGNFCVELDLLYKLKAILICSNKWMNI